MSKTVRVPEPVFEEIVRESERRDVSRGSVVEGWMNKAEKYKKIEDRQR